MLAVQKDYRRQHIGSTLLSSFLNEMRQHKVTRVELEVRTSNKNALLFYQARGFQVQATLQQFYQNGENAFSMSKEL
jgi:ribosomal-protein-alanine N-acetyltransferase